MTCGSFKVGRDAFKTQAQFCSTAHGLLLHDSFKDSEMVTKEIIYKIIKIQILHFTEQFSFR